MTLFDEADFDSDWWDDCDLKDVIVYCRGSKLLKIPDGWRALIPTEI